MPKSLLGVLAVLFLQGCMAGPTPLELAKEGTSYELTGGWCAIGFSDGSHALFEGACKETENPVESSSVNVPAGTCIRLTKTLVLPDGFSRSVMYEFTSTGLQSTVLAQHLPDGSQAAKTIVRKDCAA